MTVLAWLSWEAVCQLADPAGLGSLLQCELRLFHLCLFQIPGQRSYGYLGESESSNFFVFEKERERENTREVQVEREGERTLSKLHVRHGSRCGAQSHDPEIVTSAEIES